MHQNPKPREESILTTNPTLGFLSVTLLRIPDIWLHIIAVCVEVFVNEIIPDPTAEYISEL